MVMSNEIRNLYGESAKQSSASAFAQAVGSMINYEAMSINADSIRTQANEVELQALQRSNMLREKYNNAIGNALFSIASRGGKTSSGSVRSNLENSSKALGEDIATAQTNAKMQAQSLRLKAKLMKKSANTQMIQGILGAVAKGATAGTTANMG